MRTLCVLALLMLSTTAATAAPQWYESQSGLLYYLFDGQQHLGTLTKATGEYKPRLANGSDGPACPPPITPPGGYSETSLHGSRNHGVDLGKLHSGPAYSRNGKPCTRREAEEAILVDDSALPHLTFVLPLEALGRAKADMATNANLSAWRGKVLVQYYTPDQWAPRLRGLTEGVYLQGPDGKLLASAKSYDGPEAIDKLLRRDPLRPLLPVSGPFGIPWPAVILGGLGVLLLLRKDKISA